jgi:integrase
MYPSAIHHLKNHTAGYASCLDDERTRLLAACQESDNPCFYITVVLALSTGGRRMEILGLRWQGVDLACGIIALHETKNSERRALALTGHTLELMKEHAKIRHVMVTFALLNV